MKLEKFKGLSVVSNVSYVSYVSKKPPFTDTTDITYNLHALGILDFGQKNKIVQYLAGHQNKSYSDISETLSMRYDSVIQVMSRNPELFQETGKKENQKLMSLSPLGIDYLKQNLQEYFDKQERLDIFEKTKRLREITTINLQEELRKTIEALKKDITITGNTLIIDFEELSAHTPALSDKLLKEPEKVFKSLNEIGFLGDTDTEYTWRIKNLPRSSIKSLEFLRSTNIGELICCKARIVSRTEVRPQIVNAKFECANCGSILSLKQDGKKFKQPTRCSCGLRGLFKIINRDLRDISKVYLEDIRGNGKSINPSRLKAIATGDLCSEENIDILTPGNEVSIVGILKESEVSTSRGDISTTLDQFIEINYVETIEPEADLSQISEEELIRIKELQRKINSAGLNILSDNIAPHIFKDEQKRQIVNALCLQASTPENNPKDKTIRNQFNTLLIGDPGTAKSELAEFILDCVPGSQKAVGGGSSAVGITASVVKEPEEFGGYRVEAGTLPRSKVLCLIDELNNLSEEDKPKLQEGMESKFVTINKANIHTRIPVTSGIIATANPIKGRFTTEHSIIDEFNIPLPILNRFDVIFPFFDRVDNEIDSNIAKKMIERKKEKIAADYPVDFLKKFFLYLRSKPEPLIDEEMSKKLMEVYVSIRSQQKNNPLINPRFHNTLLRFVIASARIRGNEYVDVEDVQRSLDILRQSYFRLPEWKISKEEIKVPDNL